MSGIVEQSRAKLNKFEQCPVNKTKSRMDIVRLKKSKSDIVRLKKIESGIRLTISVESWVDYFNPGFSLSFPRLAPWNTVKSLCVLTMYHFSFISVALLSFILSIEAIAEQCFSHFILWSHSQPDSMKKRLSTILLRKLSYNISKTNLWVSSIFRGFCNKITIFDHFLILPATKYHRSLELHD